MAKFDYKYHPGVEAVTITTKACSPYIIDFEYLPKLIRAPVASMVLDTSGQVYIKLINQTDVWLRFSDFRHNVVCLDGKTMTKYTGATRYSEILLLNDDLYLPSNKIAYVKEGIYYDRYLNEIAPIPLDFMKPADLISGSMEIIRPGSLYTVSSLTIASGTYARIPQWKCISDPMFAIQTDDGTQYVLLSYKNTVYKRCYCLTNSTELIPFVPIEPYVPVEGELLIFKDVEPNNEIYRVGDVFLTYNSLEYYPYLLREIHAINPKCGQFTKPAPRGDII